MGKSLISSASGVEPTRHYVTEDFSTAFRAWRDHLLRLTRLNRAEPESYHSHQLAAGPASGHARVRNQTEGPAPTDNRRALWSLGSLRRGSRPSYHASSPCNSHDVAPVPIHRKKVTPHRRRSRARRMSRFGRFVGDTNGSASILARAETCVEACESRCTPLRWHPQVAPLHALQGQQPCSAFH